MACGLQLNLVQAAHIVPVSHEPGSDATHNGIAACYLHHAAYDRRLITFDAQYRMHANEAAMHQLADSDRAAGREAFEQGLRPLIILPPALSDRPHEKLIQIANQIRGWDL